MFVVHLTRKIKSNFHPKDKKKIIDKILFPQQIKRAALKQFRIIRKLSDFDT
jgi:hypothetical protein